ncbi:hypothetical protein SFB21_3252 [Acinetobacter bouvetii]|uniref:Uncharacterized protein n=1 Tax=Acinetobacter bouvetii TaxID=202951 RepID=A0A811GI25_9GAMM|nr:hypothetical protein SFB21_3252 [Acinetobacter bouvetii]
MILRTIRTAQMILRMDNTERKKQKQLEKNTSNSTNLVWCLTLSLISITPNQH